MAGTRHDGRFFARLEKDSRTEFAGNFKLELS
jgi:hypothetical protein